MKKFYIFYLKSSDGVDLYAYTSDKTMKDEFVRTRDMTKFIYKKIKLSNDQMNDMYKEYLNADLHWFNGLTKDKNTMKPVHCKLLTTKMESLHAEDLGYGMLTEYLYQFLHVYPELFKDKYQDALKRIGYTDLHIAEQNEEMPFNVSVDSVGSFIFLYGDTLKGRR